MRWDRDRRIVPPIRGSEDHSESEDLVALPWWAKWPVRVGWVVIGVAVVVDIVQLLGR